MQFANHSLSYGAMGSTVQRLLWVLIAFDLITFAVFLPEINDREFINECVREHNRARSSVSPPASNMFYMTWDEGLAITARAWARRCMFVHNIYLRQVRRVHPTFSSVGENIWTSTFKSNFDATHAIKAWVNEKNDYDYHENTCHNVCGHYTQVVWENSYKVGCAVQLCPNGVTQFSPKEGVIFVCNYATAGNINGRRPYESRGGSCSACNGTCEDGLCRSKGRDVEKSYTWVPDWDHVSATSGGTFTYVTILVVRPIAVIFTLMAAFAVRHFYPDVFFYE